MFKLVLFVVSLVLACQAITDEQVIKEWKAFQEKTEKTYRSPVEAAKRLTIFKENLEKIEAHNALFNDGKVTYKMGVTKFTDLTSEEFLQYVNKFKMAPKKLGKLFVPKSVESLPDSVDWRDQGVVMGVKDQGGCGACWAFSACGAMESHYAIASGNLLSLSEQNLLDCATTRFGNYGCDGGNMDGAFYYTIQNGIDTESNYPYEEWQGSCRQSNVAVQISNYADIADEDGIKNAVATAGPVSIGIDATDALQNYISGVLVDPTCSTTIPTHGVVVVGYGTQDGQDYWLIRNSWGANWGEDGYFKLIRNQGACAITSMASYPIV